MTKTVNIPLTELREIYVAIEALVFASPADTSEFAAWKQQLNLRVTAASALGKLKAYTIDLAPEPKMEYEYTLDHYGLDNWQAEWGDGDIERNIVVQYNEADSFFEYRVLMDGEDITKSLNQGNRKAFQSLMVKERAARQCI